MYKAIKDDKIIAVSDTDSQFFCLVNDQIVEDLEHVADDYEQYEGEYILKEDYPIEARNEEIRQQRQARYEVESDPIRLDYDEALARGEDTAETLKQEWLASKDKIREELPYIEPDVVPEEAEEPEEDADEETEDTGNTEQEEIS